MTTFGKCFRTSIRTLASRLIAIPVLGFVVSVSFVARAEPLTRDEAIARAMTQHPEVAVARARVAEAKARKEQADSARFPMFSIDVGIGPSLQAELVPGTAVQSTENRYSDFDFDELSAVFIGQLDLIQPIYTFGKIDERRKAARHEIAAREAQKEITQAEIAREVARLYEGLLYARAAERFFQEMLDWLEDEIADTKRRLEAEPPDPTVTQSDLLRFRSGMGLLELGLHRAQAGVEQAQAGLVAYLGYPEGTTIEPKPDVQNLIEGAPGSPDGLVELALERRPELEALAQGTAAFTALAEAERAGLKPDVFAWVFFRGAYTPGRDLVDSRFAFDPFNRADPGLFLGLRWQIQGLMAKHRAQEQLAKANQLAHRRQWAIDGTPAQVRRAYTEVQRAQRDVESTRTAVEHAKEWMVRVSSDFALGLEDARTLSDAAQTYVRLRTAEMDATFRHNEGLAELAKATGTLGTGRFYLNPEKPDDATKK